MKVSFFSNYLNEHQLPLCQAWNAMTEVEFTFIALAERGGNAGRHNLNSNFEFVLREYEDEEAANAAMFHALNDDIVIFGHMGGKEQYVKERMITGKCTFRATERPLKRGYWWAFAPPKVLRMYKWFTQYKKQSMYVLCISAYASYDLRLCGWPLDKCFVWGYFPSIAKRNVRFYAENKSFSLLWAARLIDLKRPFAPLMLAKRLKSDGYLFHLTVAGNGPRQEDMLSYIAQNNLSDVVTMVGLLSSAETKALMCRSDIYLTTSTRKEGWGITINEAMGACCAVIASASVGSAPLLIEDGVNGLLYDDRSGDQSNNSLYAKVKMLLDNPNLIEEYGANARHTVDGEWSAAEAAKRLIDLAQCIEMDKETPFKTGPCSLAKPLKNGWYKKKAHLIGR